MKKSEKILIILAVLLVVGLVVDTALGYIHKEEKAAQALWVTLPEDGQLVDYNYFLGRSRSTWSYPGQRWDELIDKMFEGGYDWDFQELDDTERENIEANYIKGKLWDRVERFYGWTYPLDVKGYLCQSENETVLYVVSPMDY